MLYGILSRDISTFRVPRKSFFLVRNKTFFRLSREVCCDIFFNCHFIQYFFDHTPWPDLVHNSWIDIHVICCYFYIISEDSCSFSPLSPVIILVISLGRWEYFLSFARFNVLSRWLFLVRVLATVSTNNLVLNGKHLSLTQEFNSVITSLYCNIYWSTDIWLWIFDTHDLALINICQARCFNVNFNLIVQWLIQNT